ncbi:DUF4116 domain-containing protein [Burkholderia contaminans]|uniref:DUF4116 domain-containing protein n=1 Tax=Burkholderia contaminans TaxID=488447 RepID=UPI0018DD95F9|nr:DUF4116 domain-containing protein [Burkholderia contaminans]MBH9720532.1 DUF4116 domain-containing protein [Burkholderia contaminans]
MKKTLDQIEPIQITDDFEKMAQELYQSDCKDKSKLLPQEYFDNEKFMIACVEQDGDLAKYASDRLKNSREFALEALDAARSLWFGTSTFPLTDMSDEVRNDRDFYLSALNSKARKDGIMNSMGDELKQDKEIVLAYAHAIHAETWDDDWRDAKSNETAQEKFKHYLKADPELIERARQTAERPNASERNKHWFETLSVQGQSSRYYSLPSNLLADKPFAMDLVAADPAAYLNLDRHLQKDTDIALQALKGEHQFYPVLDRELLDNKDFAQQAVKVSAEIFHYLGDELRADREVFKDALSHKDFKPIAEGLTKEVEQELHGTDYKRPATSIEPSFLSDRELVLEMGKKDKEIVAKASYPLRNDPELILETKAYDHMSDKLKSMVGNQDPEQALNRIVNKNKLDTNLAQKDPYEDMMRKLGIQHKDKQEQSITRAGKSKL